MQHWTLRHMIVTLENALQFGHSNSFYPNILYCNTLFMLLYTKNVLKLLRFTKFHFFIYAFIKTIKF